MIYTGTIPPEIKDLKALSWLDLSYTSIEGTLKIKEINHITVNDGFSRMVKVVIHSFTNDVPYSYPHLLQA